jgi:hypothetical protein
MPGQSCNLDETELTDLLGYCSSDSRLFLPDSGFEDGGNYIEVRNPEVTVRIMPENEDFGDNDRDNRYELQCFFKCIRN